MSRSLALLRISSENALRARTSSRRCACRAEQISSRHLSGSSSSAAPRRLLSTTAVPRREKESRTVYVDDEDLDETNSGRSRSRNSAGRPDTVPYPKYRPRADPAPLQAYLKRLLPPLEFPSTVATQMLTHISATEAWAGHNARLSFVGRRVLNTYLLLFLHNASSKLSPTGASALSSNTVDFDRVAYRALYTQVLGEHVGNAWDLQSNMIWTPATPKAPLSRRFAEERASGSAAGAAGSGLYKVQGTTVEGVMGGVFHQFGGVIAQRVFHTRVLPHILLPGTPFGLHDAFHEAALEAQARLGGPNVSLITPEEANSTPRATTKSTVLSPPSPRRPIISSIGLTSADGSAAERVKFSRVGRGSQEPRKMALL